MYEKPKEEPTHISPEEYGHRVSLAIQQSLTRYDDWQKMVKSRDSVLSLEDDIDLPMKKVIAMLSLLDITTFFTCCGFNYNGQLMHKEHVYGNWQVLMLADTKCMMLTKELVDSMKNPKFRPLIEYKYFGTSLTWIYGINSEIRNWDKPECPHSSEISVIITDEIEKFLMDKLNDMKDISVVYDFNDYMLKRYSNWQYPAKLPWTVSKQKLLDGDYDATK